MGLMLKAILLVALPLITFSPLSGEHPAVERDVPLSKINRLAKDLAKYHFADAAELVVTTYEELGATERLVAALRKTVEKSLEKQLKKPPTSKQVQALAKASRTIAVDLEKESKKEAAEKVIPEDLLVAALVFDSQNKEANEALGNQLCDDGLWRSAENAKVFTRRADMAINAERLRRQDYTLISIPKEELDPILLSATVGPASGLRGTGELDAFTLCGSIPESELRQEALKLLRTMHWASWLVKEGRPVTYPNIRWGCADRVLLLRKKEYERAIDLAVDADRYDLLGNPYPPEKIKHALGSFSTMDPRRRFTNENMWLSALRGFHHINGSGALHGDTYLPGPEWLSLASNEYCVRYMYGESVARLLGETAEEEGGTQAQKVLRVSRLLPTAGIVGCREYVRELVAAGKDPHISRIIHIKQDADLSGDLRIKAISVAEYLHETERFVPFIKRFQTYSDSADSLGLIEQTEKAMGFKLDVFEEKWKSWVLGNEHRSVIDLLNASTGQEAHGPPAVALAKLNAQRKAAGLAEVALNAGLSKGCQLHADYLDNHPERHDRWPDAHLQDAQDEDFSPEGAWAGRNSVIAFNGAKACIDEWLGTFYHRLPLTTANLIQVGFGVSDKGVAVLDAGSLSSADGTYKIVWPYDGQEDVGLRFIPEIPNPLDPRGLNPEMLAARGYPITLQLGKMTPAKNVTMWVSEEGSDDPIVGDLLGPGNAIFPENVPKYAWCFIPSKPLTPKTTYSVSYQLEDGGYTYTSSFKTGNK